MKVLAIYTIVVTLATMLYMIAEALQGYSVHGNLIGLLTWAPVVILGILVLRKK